MKLDYWWKDAALLPVIRHALLLGPILVLLVATFVLWTFRFERVDGLPVWRLEDMRSGLTSNARVEWISKEGDLRLRLSTTAGDAPLALRLAMPGIRSLDALHLRFRLSSDGLKQGNQRWDDGRFMLEWHPASEESELKIDAVGSTRDDSRGKLESFVIEAPEGSWTPLLQVAHHGKSGSLELSDVEITAVKERSCWVVGRWLLAMAWLLCVAAGVRGWSGVSWGRALVAGAIWVMMGINFVIPGPWKVQRAMGGGFDLRTELHEPAVKASSDGSALRRDPASGFVETVGELPVQGSLPLRIKHAISQARPLLHMLLFTVPTLAFMLLAGRGAALVLGILLALAIELAQVVFGYGFGWGDVGDLASDAGGILLALFLGRWILAWTARKPAGGQEAIRRMDTERRP